MIDLLLQATEPPAASIQLETVVITAVITATITVFVQEPARGSIRWIWRGVFEVVRWTWHKVVRGQVDAEHSSSSPEGVPTLEDLSKPEVLEEATLAWQKRGEELLVSTRLQEATLRRIRFTLLDEGNPDGKGDQK